MLVASARQVAAIRARVHRMGCAPAAGRRNAAIAAVAVPVFRGNGQFAGAMTALGLRGDLDDSPDGDIATRIRRAARSVAGT
jgi:DNA-binding IclR family transcriptional regulator